MNRIHLRLICRTDRLNAVDEKLTSSCQTFEVILLNRSCQTYWKDDRCTEVNYEFSSSIILEQWYQFFCSVFGAENTMIEEDGKSFTHCGSPILNEADVFAYLYIGNTEICRVLFKA